MEPLVVDIREAEKHFASLTPHIRRGETIVLCDASRPLAEIRPCKPTPTQRRPFGLARGLFELPADFGGDDAEIEQMFYGPS
jgi:antitoxin (DNA-binding transcriptional repressor) of toxin-antitoxin stability system